MSPLLRAAAVLWCLSLGMATLPLRALGAQNLPQALPEGSARTLVATQCVACHALDITLSKRGTDAEWRVIVQSMVERGAPIAAGDAVAVAAYLGQHFGPGVPLVVAAPSGAVTLADGPGKDVLTSRCFQCHQMSMWSALHQDRKAWESVLYRMVGRGALWTQADIDAMAGYLTRVAGPRP